METTFKRVSLAFVVPACVLFLPAIAVAMPIEHSPGECSSLLSNSEILKSETLFKGELQMLLSGLNEPRVKLIWEKSYGSLLKEFIGSMLIEPGLWGAGVTDPAIPQIPIPFERKKLNLTVLTQSREDDELARIPTYTEFSLEPIILPLNIVQFALINKAKPISESSRFLDLHVRRFLVNTLTAISAVPYVNYITFVNEFFVNDRHRKEMFKKIVEGKNQGLSGRQILRDIFPEREALIQMSSSFFELDEISITASRKQRNSYVDIPDFSKAQRIEIIYHFYISSILTMPGRPIGTH